jgi:hypothetical protein
MAAPRDRLTWKALGAMARKTRSGSTVPRRMNGGKRREADDDTGVMTGNGRVAIVRQLSHLTDTQVNGT